MPVCRKYKHLYAGNFAAKAGCLRIFEISESNQIQLPCNNPRARACSGGKIRQVLITLLLLYRVLIGARSRDQNCRHQFFPGTMPGCAHFFDKYLVSQALRLFKFCTSSSEAGGELVSWLAWFLVQVWHRHPKACHLNVWSSSHEK